MKALSDCLKKTMDNGEGILSVSLAANGIGDYRDLYTTLDYLIAAGLDQLIMISCIPEIVNLRTVTNAEEKLFMEGIAKGTRPDMFFDSVKAVRDRYPELPVICNPPLGDLVYYGMKRYVNRCASLGIIGWDDCHYQAIKDPAGYRKMIEEAGIGFICSVAIAGADLENKEHRKRIEEAVRVSSGELFFVPGEPGASSALRAAPLKKYVDFIREIQEKYDNRIPIVSIGGINTAEDAYELVRIAGTDGVHFSSAFIKRKLMCELEEVLEWLKGIKKAMAI